MTVSPAWPQDGNRQPKAADNGVESDDSIRSPALPPTLFKLPNLNRAPEQSKGSDDPPRSPTPPAVETTPPAVETTPPAVETTPPAVETTTSTPAAAVESSSRTAAPENSKAAASETPKASAPETPKAAQETPKAPAPETPKAATPQRTPSSERAPLHPDKPAGRSWMETIGSHGVVVVLLLVVVTAALVTGRNSGNHESDSSLAETDELLDFSEGTEFDLPLPNHGSDESTGFASSVEVESSTPVQDPTLSALESDVSVNKMIAAAGVEPTVTSNPAADPTVNSVVSLDAPHPSSTDTSETSGSELNGGRIEVNRAKVNPFSSMPANVDVLAASSRFPAESGASTLPTLEDLADDPTSASEQYSTIQAAPTRLLSQTPAGISDWLQYLPAYESARAAGSEIPSTSK